MISEYDAVTRLGITDPKAYIKRVITGPDADGLEFLGTACVGKSILAQVEAGIQEELANGDWVDVEVLTLSFFFPTSFLIHS